MNGKGKTENECEKSTLFLSEIRVISTTRAACEGKDKGFIPNGRTSCIFKGQGIK